MSTFHPIPWCPWLESDLNHVFTNLKVVPGKKHQLSRSKRRNQQRSEDAEALLTNLFNSQAKIRCLVEGPAGIGKSTLCRRIQSCWSNGNFEVFGRHFDLVLGITARTLTKDIESSIVDQLFPRGFEVAKERVCQCLHYKQENCLLIIDGLDELTSEGREVVMELTNGKTLRGINLLMTGRPESTAAFVAHAGTHLEIQGFTNDNVKSCIHKYLKHKPEHAEKLLDRLDSDRDLRALAHNPFNTLLLCLLAEDSSGDIPTDRSKILHEVISAVLKKYISRQNGRDLCNESELLQAAAYLAYTWTSAQVLVSLESDMTSVCMPGFKRHLLKSGILCRDFTLSRLNPAENCYFPHRSIQEYLCGYFLSTLNPDELKKKIEALSDDIATDMDMYMYLFKFPVPRAVIREVCETLCRKEGKRRLIGIPFQDLRRLHQRLSYEAPDILVDLTEVMTEVMAEFFIHRVTECLTMTPKESVFTEGLICAHMHKLKPPVISGRLWRQMAGKDPTLIYCYTSPSEQCYKGPEVSKKNPWTFVQFGYPDEATKAMLVGVRISIIAINVPFDECLCSFTKVVTCTLDLILRFNLETLWTLADSIERSGEIVTVLLVVSELYRDTTIYQRLLKIKSERETSRVRYIVITEKILFRWNGSSFSYPKARHFLEFCYLKLSPY